MYERAVRNCTINLAANYGGTFTLAKQDENPFKMDYDPGLDTSPELDSDAVSYYRIIVGVLRWMIKLGQIYIITEMSLLSSHVAHSSN